MQISVRVLAVVFSTAFDAARRRPGRLRQNADHARVGPGVRRALVHGARDLDPNLQGWWRIIDTSQWINDGLHILGPALISITGYGDRLRMHCLLAYVNLKPTKGGASFTWSGAWEFDQMSGTGSVKLGKDGKLYGRIRIKDGDKSDFIAERTTEPTTPIEEPPSYRDKWGPRRRW